MSASRGRLLIIDDEDDLREMLEFILAGDGFEVSTAASGTIAVELARRQPFDLAVTDMRMPGMDGIETLTALRKIDPSMEVIVATAYASEETAAECMRRGAYGYLRKPFELDALRELIERGLARRFAAGSRMEH